MSVEALLAAAVPAGIARAAQADGWAMETILSGSRVHCLVADPLEQEVVYAGTEEGDVLRSADRGATWERAGGIPGRPIRSLAVSPHEAGAVYAGVRPADVFRSRDHGTTWEGLEGFRRIRRRRLWFSPAGKPFTAYVHALALSPTDPHVLLAGVEYGAVVRSDDGGASWSGHRRGALRDCHSLCFHAHDGDRVYEGGYGGGAFSRDAGRTWSRPREGLDRRYGWAVAADPERPEVWYVSAAPGPGKAHGPGPAEAFVFRKVGEAPWEKLGGGLPQPLDSMPYTLATHSGAAGSLVAGLANGEVWQSGDLGESWARLPVELPENVSLLVLA